MGVKSVKVDDITMYSFEVGVTTLDQYAGMGDGNLLDYNEDDGFTLYVFMNKLEQYEINEIISTGSPFSIYFTEIKGCGFISLKFGCLPVGDCVFDPRGYADKKEQYPFEGLYDGDTEGICLKIVLVDPSEHGLIKGLRIIGLGNKFSRKFAKWCRESIENPIPREEISQIVDEVFKKYTPNELLKMATMYYKL